MDINCFSFLLLISFFFAQLGIKAQEIFVWEILVFVVTMFLENKSDTAGKTA